MEPVKLVLVSLSLNRGGAERFVSILLNKLDRSKVSPHLVLLRGDIGYPVPRDIPVTILDYTGLLSLPGATLRLTNFLRKTKPRVILSNGSATSIITGSALCLLSSKPAWVARLDNNPEKHDRGLRRIGLKFLYPQANRLVASSRGMAEAQVRAYSIDEDRLSVIPTPADVAFISSQAEKEPPKMRCAYRALVFGMGRLVVQKRWDTLLRAFSIVTNKLPAQLWICGDGPDLMQQQELSRSLGLTDRVAFLGYRDNPYCLLRQADVFALASDYEGMPNSLLEAQACGAPRSAVGVVSL